MQGGTVTRMSPASVTLTVGLLALAAGAPTKGSARPKATPPPSSPVAPAPPLPGAAEARALTSPQLLQRARALNEELEFEKLVPFALELVGRADAPLELKQEGFLLLGAAYVILGDPVAAELPFTQLLRVAPGFELPASVEPKVALVFKKVQGEERELARQLKEVQRRARIEGIAIRGDPPASAVGGRPLVFRHGLVDPLGDVRTFRVAYHRPGEKAFSSLALAKGPDGVWSGALPAEVTASSTGLELTYYLETADAEGPLRLFGSADAPRRLTLAPGQVEVPWRGPLPRWPFFAGAGLTVAAAAVSGTLYFNYRAAQDDYSRYVGSQEPLSLELVDQKRVAGIAAAQRLTAALITAGALAAVSLVLGILADW